MNAGHFDSVRSYLLKPHDLLKAGSQPVQGNTTNKYGTILGH